MSAAVTGMRVSDLIKVLETYMYRGDDSDPVIKFVSNESGGYWPQGRDQMAVFTDHQVAVVKQPSGHEFLQISLMVF